MSCCRLVDDYYIYTKRSTQVQEIIAFVRNCLSKYELNFNESKLQINESPFLYGKPWIEQVKQYIYLQPDVFLSKLIMEYNTYKDIAIIKYGLTVIAQCRYTVTINLKRYYPYMTENVMLEVSDESPPPSLWEVACATATSGRSAEMASTRWTPIPALRPVYSASP